MTENTNVEPKGFGELLEEYEYTRPKRGQILDAEVMQMENDRILLDLGAKTDAVVTPHELKKTDESILEKISEGDVVPVYVLRPSSLMNNNPIVSLQRGVEKADWDHARKLHESGEIIKLKIVGKNKGGLLIQMGRLQGFLPASLIPAVERASSKIAAEKVKSNLIGEDIYLKIIDVDQSGRKLIFSVKDGLDTISTRMISELKPGETREGIVVNLVDYGAFIDLYGVDGLLHISELDWVQRDHPSEILEMGDKIKVKILKIDEAEQRITLSRKALIDIFAVSSLDEDE